jgi:hypothetical protein
VINFRSEAGRFERMILSFALLTVACLAFGLVVGLEKTASASYFG